MLHVVVMLTGNIDEKVAKDAWTMGAFDHVGKPFNLQVLDRIVGAAVLVGTARAWTPSGGVNRAAPRPRTLTAEQMATIVRNGATPMRRGAS